MDNIAIFFTQEKKFRLLYFSLVIMHIGIKYFNKDIWVTLLTKQWFLAALITFFYMNSKSRTNKSFKWMLLGLTAFWIGDFFLIFLEQQLFLNLGLAFFIIGKLSYSIRFTNKKDFKISKIIPFILGCFFYIIFLMSFLLDSLDGYFSPIIAYIFITTIVGLFAFLRQYEVNKKSFILVFIGVLFSFVSDSLSFVYAFYNQFYLSKFSFVILFYSISQYLIVTGILKED